jgi:transposase
LKCRNYLSDLQKSVITTRLRDGVSIRTIARKINVAKNIVAKPKFEQTGTIGRKQGTGRMKVSQGNDALLVNFLEKNALQYEPKLLQIFQAQREQRAKG